MNEDLARKTVEAFLRKELGFVPSYHLMRDGDDGWAFQVFPEDTASYLHGDDPRNVEWLGTAPFLHDVADEIRRLRDQLRRAQASAEMACENPCGKCGPCELAHERQGKTDAR